MPFYRIYHPRHWFAPEDKAKIAKEFTRVHASETGAPPFDVKVTFIELHPNSVFSGGEPEDSHVRVEGLIKGGRSPQVKEKILAGLDKALQPWSKEGSIQTTLVEALPTDLVRHAGEFSSQESKNWAADAPPQKFE